MKAITRSRKKPPYGPNIVRAWFDTVIQPALRGLETEQSFLERKNWTFRFHPLSLEFIGPLREHLPGGLRRISNSFSPSFQLSVPRWVCTTISLGLYSPTARLFMQP